MWSASVKQRAEAGRKPALERGGKIVFAPDLRRRAPRLVLVAVRKLDGGEQARAGRAAQRLAVLEVGWRSRRCSRLRRTAPPPCAGAGSRGSASRGWRRGRPDSRAPRRSPGAGGTRRSACDRSDRSRPLRSPPPCRACRRKRLDGALDHRSVVGREIVFAQRRDDAIEARDVRGLARLRRHGRRRATTRAGGNARFDRARIGRLADAVAACADLAGPCCPGATLGTAAGSAPAGAHRWQG